MQKKPSYFSAQDYVNVFLGSLQISRLIRTTEVCTRSRRFFRFFFSCSTKSGKLQQTQGKLWHRLVQKKYEGLFCTLLHEIWLSITKVKNDFTGSGQPWTQSCWPRDWPSGGVLTQMETKKYCQQLQWLKTRHSWGQKLTQCDWRFKG